MILNNKIKNVSQRGLSRVLLLSSIADTAQILSGSNITVVLVAAQLASQGYLQSSQAKNAAEGWELLIHWRWMDGYLIKEDEWNVAWWRAGEPGFFSYLSSKDCTGRIRTTDLLTMNVWWPDEGTGQIYLPSDRTFASIKLGLILARQTAIRSWLGLLGWQAIARALVTCAQWKAILLTYNADVDNDPPLFS